jgi:hypothetical protein
MHGDDLLAATCKSLHTSGVKAAAAEFPERAACRLAGQALPDRRCGDATDVTRRWIITSRSGCACAATQQVLFNSRKSYPAACTLRKNRPPNVR